VLFPHDKSINPDLAELPAARLAAHLASRGHCSALIKVRRGQGLAGTEHLWADGLAGSTCAACSADC
jgi:hypothetical protein